MKTIRGKNKKKYKENIPVTLAGAPNVGKSTVFNALTGLKQHTGNWTGKTVESAKGYFVKDGVKFTLTDIPGTYSLEAKSEEERVAKEYIESHPSDVTVVVCDASCLSRSLPLALQIMRISPRVVIFLNLCDEAEKRGIAVDAKRLGELLSVPVVTGAARSKKGIGALADAARAASGPRSEPEKIRVGTDTPEEISGKCASICKEVVSGGAGRGARERALDRVFAGKATAFPVMALFLALIFWLTIKGANYPSDLLSRFFGRVESVLSSAITPLCGERMTSFFAEGVFRTAAWIVAVMLPPMAIFFPLFTLLEDLGYLPRVAFCLDRVCRGCGGCGKQALCMCMGVGCNAAGVTGCRIIDSKRERLIAILTNSFIPCNGRYPALLALIVLFFMSDGSSAALPALMMTCLVALSAAASLAASKLLSVTLFKGVPSSFALELPPYRTPKIGETVVRSVFDRTLRVLGRALCAAAPAGAVIWLAANVRAGGIPILTHAASFFDPLGRFMGLDGTILLAFILGLPANEIILPLIIMIYTSRGSLPPSEGLSSVYAVLTANGWTASTALCAMILYLFHSPCATTLITVKKETGSVKYAALSAALPVSFGVVLCAAVNAVSNLF